MKNELVRHTHSVGECNLHLQFTPAYRQDVFIEPLVRELTIAYLVQKAQELDVNVAAIECGPDHIHLFIKNWRKYSISKLAQFLKGYSSKMIREGHQHLIQDKLWGKKFWSEGYFFRTVGAVTAETVKKYVEEGQQKHWTEHEQKQQKTLFNYTS